jgi:hypothetical protein
MNSNNHRYIELYITLSLDSNDFLFDYKSDLKDEPGIFRSMIYPLAIPKVEK